jgi:hypothetical protein
VCQSLVLLSDGLLRVMPVLAGWFRDVGWLLLVAIFTAAAVDLEGQALVGGLLALLLGDQMGVINPFFHGLTCRLVAVTGCPYCYCFCAGGRPAGTAAGDEVGGGGLSVRLSCAHCCLWICLGCVAGQ